jgi:hypothetical protein
VQVNVRLTAAGRRLLARRGGPPPVRVALRLGTAVASRVVRVG